MAWGKSRTELLLPTPGSTQSHVEDKVFLITTYHPHDQSLRKTIFSNWCILKLSPTMDFVYKKLLCRYRRPKNLRDALVWA